MTIDTIAITGSTDFSYTFTGSSSIPVGTSRNVLVSFLPTTSGSITGNLIITFEDGVESASVSLGGGGVYGSVAPSAHAFPFVFAGNNTTQNIQITNNGTVPLPVNSLAMGGAHASSFVILNETLSGTTLGISSSSTVTVQYVPSTSSASEVTLLGELKLVLDVAAGFPAGQYPAIDITGTTQKKPSAKLQFEASSGNWQDVTGPYDFGEVFNECNASGSSCGSVVDKTVKLRILNDYVASSNYGGDLVLSKFCFQSGSTYA